MLMFFEIISCEQLHYIDIKNNRELCEVLSITVYEEKSDCFSDDYIDKRMEDEGYVKLNLEIDGKKYVFYHECFGNQAWGHLYDTTNCIFETTYGYKCSETSSKFNESFQKWYDYMFENYEAELFYECNIENAKFTII